MPSRPNRLRTLGLLAATAWSCAEPPKPALVEGDIPVSRTVEFRFYKDRVGVATGEQDDAGSEAALVTRVSRASTERFIRARAIHTDSTEDGGLAGTLGLHEGWRQEFFAMPNEVYAEGLTLPSGDLLLWDITPVAVTRLVGARTIIPSIPDRFTAMITRVLEVPSAGRYVFRGASDDGSIGTLQDLSRDLHDVDLLWYDWRPRPMGDPVLEARRELEPGFYLLTVHYYEDWGDAGYLIEAFRDVPAEPTG